MNAAGPRPTAGVPIMQSAPYDQNLLASKRQPVQGWRRTENFFGQYLALASLAGKLSSTASSCLSQSFGLSACASSPADRI